MQKHQNIKALFFLGIFSLLLLHQTVPHLHHEHQEEHHHGGMAHGHHHDHHHEESGHDDLRKGFFGWFLDMHVHTNTTTDVVVLERTSVTKVSVQKDLAKAVVLYQTDLDYFEETPKDDIRYHPPDNLQSTHSSNPTLRGPPSLG